MKRAPKKIKKTTTDLKLTDLTKVRGGGKVIRDGKLTADEYLDCELP